MTSATAEQLAAKLITFLETGKAGGPPRTRPGAPVPGHAREVSLPRP